MKLTKIPVLGDKSQDVKSLQVKLNELGASPSLKVDGDFGPKTMAALSAMQKKNDLPGSGIIGPKTMALLGFEVEIKSVSTSGPIYPKPHEHHPRFDHLLKPPFTHLHPFDVLRSVAGEKEIPGSKDNELIAHFHEHAGNLGTHSDSNDYSDEVAHCSSAINWACDMAGCRKTNNALASSWSKYNNPRRDTWVEVGDIIHIKNGNQNHVTFCNKRFNKEDVTTFEGFGSNQGNTIKTSIYKVSSIKSVQIPEPLPGTVLAPIGVLGTKPIAASGSDGESTR